MMQNNGSPSHVGDVICRRFSEFGFPLVTDRNIIPPDDSTLFVCSGMQRVRNRFKEIDGGRHGSIQSCIRTNDLGLVGDGSHLTYFEMVGNFSFGGWDYEESVELWHAIMRDLNIDVTEIRVHPTRPDLGDMWKRRGYIVTDDHKCTWSDGDISGECCEVFYGDLEIGNLVNPMRHSTDVGFGLERLHQVCEGKTRVDETNLFINHHPVVADHCRTLLVLHENNINPGNKGREYVCRRMVRRILPLLRGDEGFNFNEWIEQERERREKCITRGRKAWRKHNSKPSEWWWDTFGVLPEEMSLLM